MARRAVPANESVMKDNSSEAHYRLTAPHGKHGAWPRWIAPAALLLLVFVINFAAMPATWWAGDPTAWREETRSLLRDGVLHVNTQYAAHIGEPGQYFVFNPGKGWWYSKYGLMNSLMALPPTALEAAIHGRIPSAGEPSDLLIFNLHNILLSLLVCGLLYRITGWYADRTWVRVVYVLCTFYATFLWYYQRAQGAEIYQVLFFTAAFYFLMIYLRGLRDTQGEPNQKHMLALAAAWAFVTALLLTRIIFGLLIPTVWLAVIYVTKGLDKDRRWQILGRQSVRLLLPAALGIGILAWINQVKFGSPWLTGYHQWRPREHLPVGRWQDGIWGVLFDPQGSILLYFPILAFGLLGVREFYRRYTLDTVVLLLLPSALFLWLTKTPSWRGEWTYGPRYLIFTLPLLAMPFVVFLEWLVQTQLRGGKTALAVATVVTLGYSTFLQFQANRLGFWTLYQVSATVDDAWSQEMARYFLEHGMGTFNCDLIRHKDSLDDLPFVAELKKRGLTGQQLEDYKKLLHGFADEENFYWKRAPSSPTQPTTGQ
jgi:hypothetical protein